jgi:hypothetical protein
MLVEDKMLRRRQNVKKRAEFCEADRILEEGTDLISRQEVESGQNR